MTRPGQGVAPPACQEYLAREEGGDSRGDLSCCQAQIISSESFQLTIKGFSSAELYLLSLESINLSCLLLGVPVLFSVMSLVIRFGKVQVFFIFYFAERSEAQGTLLTFSVKILFSV